MGVGRTTGTGRRVGWVSTAAALRRRHTRSACAAARPPS